MRLFQTMMLVVSLCLLCLGTVVSAVRLVQGTDIVQSWLTLIACAAQFAAVVCAWQAVKLAEKAVQAANEAVHLADVAEALLDDSEEAARRASTCYASKV